MVVSILVRCDEPQQVQPDIPPEVAKPSDHGHSETVAAKLKEDPFKHAKDVGHIREHLKSQYGFNDKQADQYLKVLYCIPLLYSPF